MAEQLIDLKVIDPNPYQKRIASNREKVVSIAMSIASDKMLQTPTGRWVGKRFQSAIGHTRTESYRLNAQIQAGLANGKNYPKDVTPEHVEAVKVAIAAGRDFAVMPWVVEELSDEQMYRYATIENNQREDLSPIEKMEEMKGWQEFGYTSKQIAALYPGMSDATVRGLLSFDKLPKEAKDALHEGKISQGTARTLLSMQKIAPKEKIAKAIKQIEKQEGNRMPEAVIEETFEHLENVEDMWDENRRDGKPRSRWTNGWLLDMKNFPNKLLPALTPVDAAVALEIQDDEKALKLVGEYLEYIDAESAAFPIFSPLTDSEKEYSESCKAQEQKRLDQLTKLNPEYTNKLQHLLNPPACTSCPFYTKIRGSHFCGMKICHARKSVAWDTTMMEQASKKLGIAIYSKADGKYQVLDSWDHRSLFDKKDKGLRLILTRDLGSKPYQHFTDIESDVFVVVATGDAIGKMVKKSGSITTKGGKLTEKEKAERRAMRVFRQHRLELVWEYTAVAQSLFNGVPIETLRKICGWYYVGIDDRIPNEHDHPQTGTDAEKLEFQRRTLIWRLIVEETSHYTRSDMVTLLDRFYKVTGVKAPKDLMKRAQEWDAEIHELARVSTATPKQKKGKKA